MSHQRRPSESFRIAIANQPNNNASRHYTDSPRDLHKRPRAFSLGRQEPDSWSLLMSWLNGRGGGPRGTSRRWVLVVAGLTSLLIWRAVRSDTWLGGSKSSFVDLEEIPVVDRSALEKLRLLEIHYGADEDNANDEDDTGTSGDHRPPRHANGDSPPVVANIPQEAVRGVVVPARQTKVPADILDDEYCPSNPGSPCAFLLPAWLGEQETKAQLHLYQLGLLALSLNRTLVLPHVAKSRMSACFPNPFSFYYSTSSLSDLGIPTISQANFIEWAERRDPPPTAQVVSMVGAKQTYLAGAIEIDSASDPTLVPNKPTRNLCLKAPRTRLDFSGHSPLAIYPPEGYHRSELSRLGFGESVVNTLSSPEVGSKSSRAASRAAYALPNVLAFNYELRFPIMAPSVVSLFNPSLPPPLPFSHFAYSDTWTDLASTLASSLSPFIAIHWRTETLASSNLVPCASSLLRKLALLHARYPEIKNVYLATDYPIEDPTGIAHSGTFAKVVTEQHHAAFRAFLKNFPKQAKGMRLTTFAREQKNLVLPPELAAQLANVTSPAASSSDPSAVAPPIGLADLDAGLMGIIDKAVAMRAEVFVSGFAGVGKEAALGCAKVSSFTNQILEARQSALTEQKEAGGVEGDRVLGQRWNDVSRWSVKGPDED
ncbi:hypothetical protein RQP46_005111 [Phenoliferia psychrophenolica]